MVGQLYHMVTNESSLSNLKDGARAAMGIGNVYRVIKSTESYYAQFLEDYQGEYSDGSLVVHTTIQSALDATVECRNDYVIVQPANADYDITAVLTMSKKCVHLICPAGLGNKVGATNACRIHQTTAATPIIAVTDASIEIAGFYFKNYVNVQAITLSADAYSPNIHNNSFAMTFSSTTALPIIDGTSSGGGWGSIESNWFMSYSGASCTIAKIVDIEAQATCAKVSYNEFMVGDLNTITVGIYMDAVKGSADYNMFKKCGANGTWTHCIFLNPTANAIGNRGTVADSVLVTGGAADQSFSDNMNGVNGGLVDDAT